MGMCAAYTLVSRGFSVTLYDGAALPSHDNASALAGGMLAPYSEIDLMTPAFIQAGLSGIDFWRQFSKDMNICDAFYEGGSLLIAHSQDRHLLERFAGHLPDMNRESGDWERLDSASLHRCEPALPASFQNALHLKGEAAIDPLPAMHAIVLFLQAQGGGRFSFVQENIAPHDIANRYAFVLDCRGFGAAADQSALRGVKGEVALVRNPDFMLRHVVRLMHPRYPLYIVPRADHHFLIGATQIESSEGCHVSIRSAMELMSALYSLHPSFGDAEIVHIKAGIRPAYPDNLPRITRSGNVISCNGLFRHGYLLSPVIAQVVADVIMGKAAQTDFGMTIYGEAA